MSIGAHVEQFAGLPVTRFKRDPMPGDPTSTAWRIQAPEFDSDAEVFAGQFEELLETVPGEAVRALVVGEWGDSYDRPCPVDLLVSRAARLPQLRALFLAELTYEECEISWIRHDDITPALKAFPTLEVLRVRGATEGLTVQPVRHETLRELAIEAGGLPAEVTRSVAASDLPALEHLELWLGTEDYGGSTTIEDLAPILSGARLPALRHLALCNAEHADQVAAAVATAPVTRRLETLDLSKGVLTDAGVEALLAGQPLRHLRRLDLSHHFLSSEGAARIVAALPDTDVDVSDRQEADEHGGEQYLYTAVSE